MLDRPTASDPLWALGDGWKASFDRSGFTFIPFFGAEAPRNFPMRLELSHASVGGQALDLGQGEPIDTGFTVRTHRGSLIEVADLNLLHVEHSFVFETLPNRGAVAVDISISSELACETIASGLRFENEHGSVDYKKAVAIDATGASVNLDIVWTGTAAHIEIPAAFVERAQLPLVLDPFLAGNYGLATVGATEYQRNPDVANLQMPGVPLPNALSCVVWLRQFSAGDQDAFAMILDSNLVPTTGVLTLDFTGRDFLKPTVAANNFAMNFLFVSEVRLGADYYIAGRTISSVGAVGPLFDIEHQGVGGALPGNSYRPDVGGDPFAGSLAYYCVVFEKQTGPGNRDIYYRLVTTAGAVLTPAPTALDTATTDESNPSIGKNNGVDNGLGAHWFIAWQRTYPFAPNDQEVIGGLVNWNGGIIVPFIYLASSIGEEASPSASSPADINGVRYWMVAYTLAPNLATERDIYCKVVDNTGIIQAGFNLSDSESATTNAYDQQLPDVDSDGARFAITYAEPYPLPPNDLETKVSTVAFLPGDPTPLRIDDNRVSLGASISNEFPTRICAHHSGGALSTPRYVITNADDGTNDIEVYLYGGYIPGAQFNVFASQCGAMAPITPSGSTALGGTIIIDVPGGAASGTLFGTPGFVGLGVLGCPLCHLGVNSPLLYGNPFVWTVPVLPQFVGYIFSVQGFTLLGTQCLGNTVDLSDTIDFTIR